MIGEELAHFRLTAKLGEGGMGEVYRAEDTRLGREVAIKVLPEAVANDPERLARFEREAKVLASLNHPNVAGIYQVEEDDGVHFLVMELAEGETLAQRIGRGPVPVVEALPIALQIAEALEAAHEKGIIHRDLKPANVKITPEGQVKVLDFGLAKALDPQQVKAAGSQAISLSPTLTAQMTGAGVLLGTAAYMSPEQARGQEADRRSDLWALGVVVYEMLTGRQLFAGSTVSDTLAGVLRADPDWSLLPEATPAPMRRLLRRCLEREARYRLADASSARLELEDARTGREERSSAGEVEAPGAPRWRRFLPWVLLAVSAAALVVSLAVPRGSAVRREPPQQAMRLEVAVSDGPADIDLGANIALSSDGLRLAYVVANDENFELFVRSLDQLIGSRLVSGSGAESPYHPFFSPDGSWLGFVTAGELKKIPVSGGAPITLTEVNRSRGATWAPDGTIILAPDPESGLVRVPATGGQGEPVTTLDEEREEISHRWPQVLPGGAAVLFTSQTESADNYNDANIEVVSLGTGERKVIQRAGFYGRYMPGGYLLYVNDNTLFARPFDLERLEVGGSPAPVVNGVASDVGSGGAQLGSPTSDTLVFVSGQNQLEEYSILWADRAGKIETLWSEPGTYVSPRWSPSGRMLAVQRSKDDNADIWVLDLERGVATRLTFDQAPDLLPVWSPDEKHLIFASGRDGVANLYRKRADGSGEAERLTEHDVILAPNSWSSDGRRLTGVTIGQSFDLWVLELDGDGEIETFLSTPFLEWHPSFSPDGRWIAYMSDESGRYEVYVRPYPPAGGRWQISVEGGGQPRWSDDGREIFYRGEGGVMVVDVETDGDSFRVGRPRELFAGPFRGGIPGLSSTNILPDFDVDGSGQRFVFFQESNQQGRGALVTMVFHFREELDRVFAGEGR